MPNLLQQLSGEMSQTIDGVKRSLVRVKNGRGAGAGTIWQADGLIITNAHVVGRGRTVEVTLAAGQTFSGRVLARDEARDLAAVSIPAQGLPTIAIGNARQLHPGQWVMALGHPWGVEGAASAGAVITTGVPPEMNGRMGEFIQVGLQLRPGHSGGPLVDTNGRLLGINTMITGPEVGLAIPVHAVTKFLREHIGTPDVAYV